MQVVFRIGFLLAVAATAATAQRPASARLPAGEQVCDMSARAIILRLVDRAGAPISDASIIVTRVRTRARLPRVEALGSGGEYKVLEDGTLTDLRPTGEPFDVTFTHARRTRRTRIVLGLDPSRCHIELKSGASKVTF